MSRDFDLENAIRNDTEKIRRARQQGAQRPSGDTLLEYALWSLSLTSLVVMVVALPWVGTDKVIPGTVWLGYSLTGILLFGGLAYAVRLVKAHAAAVDDQMSRRYRDPRGGRSR